MGYHDFLGLTRLRPRYEMTPLALSFLCYRNVHTPGLGRRPLPVGARLAHVSVEKLLRPAPTDRDHDAV